MDKKYYITTAIPYVNGKPHIGHALEYFQADTIRRYQQLLGKETLLLSGADENALKNVQAAEKEGLSTNDYLDKYAKVWKDAYGFLGVKLDVFQRGSDKEKHWPGVQKLWNLCLENGDIYKKSYKGWYCIGCESFKTEKELVDGLCPEHLKKPDLVDEENYFFKLSSYQQKLIDLIESNELLITPENKRSEILSFIKMGLEDFSVSRSKIRAKGVGVPIPNDDNQVMYVWFDALNIYMTGIGFGWDDNLWEKWWPADVHIIGKDINRFHTVYWPAMLLSAKITLPKQILIHSFILSGGQKMSKSIGNVIDPYEIVNKYGLETVRYFLLSQIPLSEDGDFTIERLEKVYNSDLANGLGNLVARVAKLSEKISEFDDYKPEFTEDYEKGFEELRLDEVINIVKIEVKDLDNVISKSEPWKIEDNIKLKEILQICVNRLRQIAFELQPFLPETAAKIEQQFKGPKIKSAEPLFPRLAK